MSVIKVIKVALIIFVLTIISILVIFIVNLKNANSIINKEYVMTNILSMEKDTLSILYEVAQKDGNWTNLPLSDNFKSKYNSHDGIFKGDNYTYCSTKEDATFDKSNNIVCYNVDHNYKNEWYYVHYTVNDKNELDDVEIVDKILKYDENGKEVIYKETMDESYVGNIIQLAAPARLDWDPFDYVYVTDYYLHKWGGGFVDYDETGCSIDTIDELNDKNKQVVYLSVALHKLDKDGEITGYQPEKYFKVHYITDDKAWLDDVEVEEVSKEEIDRLLSEVKNNEKLN